MILVRVLQTTKLKHGVMILIVDKLYQAWRPSYKVPRTDGLRAWKKELCPCIVSVMLSTEMVLDGERMSL